MEIWGLTARFCSNADFGVHQLVFFISNEDFGISLFAQIWILRSKGLFFAQMEILGSDCLFVFKSGFLGSNGLFLLKEGFKSLVIFFKWGFWEMTAWFCSHGYFGFFPAQDPAPQLGTASALVS